MRCINLHVAKINIYRVLLVLQNLKSSCCTKFIFLFLKFYFKVVFLIKVVKLKIKKLKEKYTVCS